MNEWNERIDGWIFGQGVLEKTKMLKDGMVHIYIYIKRNSGKSWVKTYSEASEGMGSKCLAAECC